MFKYVLVCFIVLLIDKYVPYFMYLRFWATIYTFGEIYIKPSDKKKTLRKSKVFCMYETVALRPPIPTFLRPESYKSAATHWLLLYRGIIILLYSAADDF